MKARLLILMGFVALFFLGRWEGKRAADEWWKVNWWKVQPAEHTRIIQGFHIKGNCAFGVTHYIYDRIENDTSAICVIEPLDEVQP